MPKRCRVSTNELHLVLRMAVGFEEQERKTGPRHPRLLCMKTLTTPTQTLPLELGEPRSFKKPTLRKALGRTRRLGWDHPCHVQVIARSWRLDGVHNGKGSEKVMAGSRQLRGAALAVAPHRSLSRSFALVSGRAMAEITRKRSGELVRGVFSVLQEHPDGMPITELLQEVERRVPPTQFEASRYPKRPNVRRYEKIIRFSTIPTTGLRIRRPSSLRQSGFTALGRRNNRPPRSKTIYRRPRLRPRSKRRRKTRGGRFVSTS